MLLLNVASGRVAVATAGCASLLVACAESSLLDLVNNAVRCLADLSACGTHLLLSSLLVFRSVVLYFFSESGVSHREIQTRDDKNCGPREHSPRCSLFCALHLLFLHHPQQHSNNTPASRAQQTTVATATADAAKALRLICRLRRAVA